MMTSGEQAPTQLNTAFVACQSCVQQHWNRPVDRYFCRSALVCVASIQWFTMRRGSGDEEGDEDAEAKAPSARRKRKRLPGEDANLRFDEMEAYLQVCGGETDLCV